MTYLYIALGIVAFSVIGFFVSLPIGSYMCYKKFFSRGIERKELSDAHYDKFRQDICAARERMEKLPFVEQHVTAADGVDLYGRYYDYGRDKTVIFLHGASSHPFNNFSITVERFIEWGFNVLIPDMRAHGKSGGEHVTYGNRESDDLLEWIKFVTENRPAKIVLYGVSLGAATIGMASDRLPNEVRAAVYDCGFTSVGNLIGRIAKRSHAPKPMFTMLAKKCKRELGMDFDASTLDHIKNTAVPSFFIHGTEDAAVPCDDSRQNYEACSAPKQLLLVEGCGHTTAALNGDAPTKIHNFINNYL